MESREKRAACLDLILDRHDYQIVEPVGARLAVRETSIVGPNVNGDFYSAPKENCPSRRTHHEESATPYPREGNIDELVVEQDLIEGNFCGSSGCLGNDVQSSLHRVDISGLGCSKTEQSEKRVDLSPKHCAPLLYQEAPRMKDLADKPARKHKAPGFTANQASDLIREVNHQRRRTVIACGVPDLAPNPCETRDNVRRGANIDAGIYVAVLREDVR
jgi:hypothetical protein